ncbi:MAG: hypothetical protein QF464_12980 [Myxococcota bacterium]|nr:hypothetical protein [Myxococcota bacterium]
MKTPRSILRHYDDPLSLVWLRTAQRLGIRVTRSREVFASWDGAGTLTLGADEDLDPDDCLAQMILHELCHALIEGEEALARTDWGLENVDDRDATREMAAMRLQASLLAPHGLRRLLAVTTEWRGAYDALPDDPLADRAANETEDGAEEATRLAREGWVVATTGPWSKPLAEALCATAAIARAAAPFASGESLWSETETDRPRAGDEGGAGGAR